MAYELNSAIFTPNDGTMLWRYMPPLKLFHLLETQTLFFTNVSLFSDPYEGQLPKPMLYILEQNLSKTGGVPLDFTLNCYRNMMFVNCWHANWRDTKYMWDRYASDTGSIAIKTDVGSLKKSLIDKYGVHIGKISYIDYENDLFYTPDPRNIYHIRYSPYFHKQKKFDYECEVRAIINTADPIMTELQSRGGVELEDQSASLIEKIGKEIFSEATFNGLPYKVDISELIHGIIPSPYCEKWMIETIESIISHYNYNIKIGDSSLKNM